MTWPRVIHTVANTTLFIPEFAPLHHDDYDVVPKEWLTFLGSLYKGGAKTTPGTLVSRFERKTARKKKSFQKHYVLNLECRILPQEPSDSLILYFNVIFHGKQAEKDTNRPLVTSEYCENWFP